jgi:ADP-heptose:LPS heptosyltransferase
VSSYHRALQLDPDSREALTRYQRCIELSPGAAKAYNQLGINLAPDLHSFGDTAAVIDQLDLVISVDTAVLHLAGALGKPAWALIPFAPDWRWLLNREDSPWYPTLRLFRQTKPGQWPDVIERVTTSLETLSSV